MKRNITPILISVVTLTVICLIFLQLRYIHEAVATNERNFFTTVESVLYNVEREMENIEVKECIENFFKSGETDKNLLNNNYDFNAKQNILNQNSKNSEKTNSSIQGINRSIACDYHKKFSYNRELINEVLAQLMLKTPNNDIFQRMDFNVFVEKLSIELENNGITQQFYFRVKNQQGRAIFSNYQNFKNSAVKFSQQLFPNEKNAETYFAEISFPNRLSSVRQIVKMALPSVAVTVFLFIIVICTIYYLFKQKKANETKTDFLNNMTHELKTPIASISLAAQMLNDEGVGKSPNLLSHLSKVVKDETQRLSILVEKVLQTSVFESQKSIMRLKEDDINELIERVVQNFSFKVNSINGKIETSLNAKNAMALVDDMHFTNVIYNLLENSIKYRRNEPVLSICTWNEKDKLCISVEDNGIGIKKEDIKHVFERFYRVSTGNLHNVKGFGLGLAYVKKIVAEHYGTISVESEYGVGTKFIIQLPNVVDN